MMAYFSIGSNGKDIGCNQKDPKYQTDGISGKFCVPVLND
jgi:hypothetical protein